MLSIVVSSYKPNLYKQFEESVANTVGIDYEIIKIDNPGIMGLCAAYNRGIQQARYPYICFSHEDILFKSQNWGIEFISILKNDNKIGVVGIAGSSYKPWVLSGWSFEQDSVYLKKNYIQLNNGKEFHVINNPYDEKLSEVATVDGCWFGGRKSIFEEYKFDEQTFKNYHCYDLDICLNIGLQYKIIVTYDILIEHLSTGGYDNKWLEETIKLHQKWTDLPRKTESIPQNEIFFQEYFAFCALVKQFKLYQRPKLIFKISFSPKLIKILGWKNWIKFQLAFIKFSLKNK